MDVNRGSTRRSLWPIILVAVVTIGASARAEAQTGLFASSLVGYNFGGDTGCQHVDGCTSRKINAAVSVGGLGKKYGLEEEMSFSPDFLGRAPGMSSSVFTLMINGVVSPRIGPIRPYALAGLGLIRTHIQLTTTSIFATTDSDFGWDAGGGVMGFVSDHFGVRGDLRYFRSTDETNVLQLTLPNSTLRFWRVGAGVVVKF